LIFLAVLRIGAKAGGGAPYWQGGVLGDFLGAIAMAATAAIGALFGTTVA
jgi:hypothetical protein